MLTKVSEPNHLTTPNIIKWFSSNHKNKSFQIEKIQDNLEGYLVVKYKDLKGITRTQLYNYYLNKYYSHKTIQIDWGGQKILKHIDSFDQNNSLVANKLRTYVHTRISYLNSFEFKIENILGIGGEYYLYWTKLLEVKKLIGLSNHQSIIDDAKTNIPWSSNYLVNYNDLASYPMVYNDVDLVLINLSQFNSNIAKYLNTINYKKIILIICNLPDSKLKLLAKNFKILKIKYFKNFDNLIRIIEMEKKFI